jgi:hypothetical protein
LLEHQKGYKSKKLTFIRDPADVKKVAVFFEAKFSIKEFFAAWKCTVEAHIEFGLFFAVQSHIGKMEGTWEYDECSNKLHECWEEEVDLAKNVTPISKRK